MRRYVTVALGVAWRTIYLFATNPAVQLPSLIVPLFFFTAFAGGLASVGDVPGFDFPGGYTAFQFVFVLLQAAAFGGVFTGFSIAADFESGFARRMLLAAPHRTAILVGYALAGLTRTVIVSSLLFAVALLTGMEVLGSAADLLALVVLTLLVSLAAMLFAAGVAMRARTIQAGPAMQMPVFLLLFLAPVYVPVTLLSGWIKGVAEVNPVTPLIEAGRELIAGGDPAVGLAAAVVAGLLLFFAVWAVRGLRRAEAAG